MNLSSKASNVLLARCRARYGQRLTAQEIDTLLGSRTVADCSACLRNTRYAPALASLGESSMYRRPSEAALNGFLLDELYTLCRCEQSVGDWFSDYIVMQAEIRLITSFVQKLSAGRHGEMILNVPEFILHRSGIDPELLGSARSYDDFLGAVKRSRFAKVLRALRPLPGNRPDCALIEHSLYVKFFDEVIALVNRHSGSARDELMDIIGTRIDISNFRHIYRLKKYYGADIAAVRSMLIHHEHRISNSVMRSMTNADSAEEVLRIFIEKTPYGRYVDAGRLSTGAGLETETRLLIHTRARKLMRSSVNPATVLLAYITLAEAEVQDLTTIIEGVFYGVSREEIMGLITIDNLAV